MDSRVEVRDSSGTSQATVDVRERGGRLDYLDGLRGWASLSVVIFHSSTELFRYTFPWWTTHRLLLNDGQLAVALFFVLSGFVLSHQHLLRPNLQRIRATAIGRYVRLTIPIVAASFVALVLLAIGAMFNREASVIVQRADWLGTFYTFDASFWRWLGFALFGVYFNYDYVQTYDFVLWTMPIELAGSFLIFAMVALFALGPRLRLVFGLGAVAMFAHLPVYLAFVYGYLLANLQLAVRDQPNNRNLIGDLFGLALIVGAGWYRMDHDGLRTTAALGACLVLAPVLSPLLRRLLSSPLSKWLGRISFPLYLLHPLVICSVSSYLIVTLDQLGWSLEHIALVVVPVTFVFSLGAAQLFVPIERYAIRSSHRFANYVLNADGNVIG